MDLTKILKDCPNGTKLYSLVHGEVEFEGLKDEAPYPIRVSFGDGREECGFTKEGLQYADCAGECVLFPSKDQRDWSKSAINRYELGDFKPFDKVLVRDNIGTQWQIDLFERIAGDTKYDVYHEYVCMFNNWHYCIPYNEDTAYLIGTEEDCPEYYKSWK